MTAIDLNDGEWSDVIFALRSLADKNEQDAQGLEVHHATAFADQAKRLRELANKVEDNY